MISKVLAKKILLILLAFPSFLFAQEEKKSLLVIPVSKSNIQFSSLAEKNIAYNNLNRDSIINYVVRIIDSELKTVFKNYSIHYLKDFYPADELPDSIYELKLWNCFYLNSTDSSLNNLQNTKGTTMESYHNKYCGYNLNEKGTQLLKSIMLTSKCNYVLFINKFEIINPNSIFSLHIEFVDNNMKKIYGNKNELKRTVSRTMYTDVLKYYIKLSCTEMLVKGEIFLRDVNKLQPIK